MERLNQLLSDAFTPYAFDLDASRPDGGRVLTLTNEAGDIVLRRVIAGASLGSERQCEEAIENIRHDLMVQEGRIGEDVILALRQRAAQVFSFDS